MKSLEHQIHELRNSFLQALQQAKNNEQLEQVRINFLGRNGLIAHLMEQLKTLSLEEKKRWGPQLNSLKTEAQQTFDAKLATLETLEHEHEAEQKKFFDVTAYKPGQQRGTLHPYTHIIEHIENVFISMGFDIVDGPEAETDYYNFKALNVPSDHPARDMQDTFWLNVPDMLMRTHTSSIQTRVIEKTKPPIALLASGRVYRYEATDASHDFMFMQTEGMLIDKNISMANLLATTQVILRAIFEKADLTIRVRPGYFPFVEPGVEIDISCPFCKGGCSVCKKTQWVESAGAGLIHPNVLAMGGIDPEQYSGFAFGFGLTRLTMLKYGINDIRLLHSGNLDFLTQW